MEVYMSGGPPWGFTLVGGTDFRSPLRVGKVSVNGKAEKAGIVAGHYLLKINGVDCSTLKHMEAQRLVKSARETLELNVVVVELRKKTSQSKVVEPRRTSTSSLPRGMTSLSSLGSHRLSFHDDQSSFLQNPRTSSSSIGGMDMSPIPAKPAPPPGSRPRSQQFTTSDVDKLTTSSNTTVKEPSPAADDVFNKSIAEEDTQPVTTTTTTTSTVLSSATVKRPPPPPVTTPKKPVTKPAMAQPVTHEVKKPITHEVTKPVTHEVTKPVTHEVTKPVTHEVTKPGEKIRYEKKQQPSQPSFKSPSSASAAYIPSAPKTEGGSSWYKSMFRSMLANDDEVTIPSETTSHTQQSKVHSAAAAFVAAANENASKGVSPRHEPSYKPHAPASTTSSFSTGASYTTSSSYKPPPTSTTVEDSTVADQSIDDTMELMTSEQVRATLRQTIGRTTSANKGWMIHNDQDEETTSFSSHPTQSNVLDKVVAEKNISATEDIQLDKMHPIISDAAISATPPPAPVINVISPTEDQPVTVATIEPVESVPSYEPTETVPSYEPPSSGAAMVTTDKETPIEDDTIETMTTEQVKAAIKQTLSGASSNRDWDKVEDFTSHSNHEDHTFHKDHTPESNLQGQHAHVTVSDDDIQLDKMHPIISGVVMSEAPPPHADVTSPPEDLPVTIATATARESTQTTSDHSDVAEVKLDSMHPIISEAAVNADVTVTMTTEDDDLMKSTSDDLLTALEELNTVIGSSHTSSVGAVADHVSNIVKDRSHTSSRNSNISDKGNRSNSRQSDHDNRGSRSSSRQSNTSSHDNRSGSSDDRRRKTPPAESARALFNFSAQNVKELSFNKGDIIKLTRTVDNNWLEGEVDGAKGIFPTSYVELISGSNTPNAAMATPEPSKSPSPLLTSTDLPHAVAKFKFQAESAKELSFQKGDILFLTKRVDDNWYRGYNGSGVTGIFPCSYVQVMVDLEERVEYVRSPPPAEIYPKVTRRPKKEAPPRPSLPPPIRGKKMEDESSKPVVSDNHTSSNDSAAVTSFDIPGDKYESLFSYEPCNSDELGLEVGDIVVVFEKCDDGWFMGTCERTGEFGAFPGNFVRKLD